VNGNTQPFPNYGDVRNITQLQSWQLGLQWNDLFAKGNAAGFAFGQPTYVSALSQNRIRKPYGFTGSGSRRSQSVYNGFYDSPNGPNDGNFAFEWWYKFQVSNNISITPAIFYLSRPNGQFTANGETNNAFGGLVQTQFKF
jgi:carbohydrate-selective porin OprB